MTEVEEKNAKETDKVESALQRAIHITKLLIIWAARSFLYSGCTFCVFLVFHFVYGKASSNELVEVGALVCGIVWPTLFENNQVDKIHDVQHLCGCEAVRRVVCFVVIGNFLK